MKMRVIFLKMTKMTPTTGNSNHTSHRTTIINPISIPLSVPAGIHLDISIDDGDGNVRCESVRRSARKRRMPTCFYGLEDDI